MTTNQLVRVVSGSKITLGVKPENLKTSFDRVTNQIKEVEKSRKSKRFFGFEGTDTSASEATERLERRATHLKVALAGYPEQLDYSFLSWRRKQTLWPIFIVLDLKSNTFEIRDSWSSWDTNASCITPKLPEEIASQYSTTIERLSHMRGRTTLTTEFVGIMPDSARNEVVKAQKSRLFDHIFVIAEVKNWRLDQVVRAKGDPIVVGWVNNTQQMFLITMFDPTPFEQYVADQYAWKTG